MKTKKRLKRILLITSISIVALIIVIRIAIPVAGVAVANSILPGLLNTDASIGFIDMVLLRGKVSTGNIVIKQPSGFDEGNLFSLGKAAVDVDLTSLKNGPIKIELITIDELELNIVRNTNGIMNVESLASSSTTNTIEATNEIAQTSTSEPPAVTVDKIEIRDIAFSYSDFTYDPPLAVQIEDLNLTITNILFDPKITDSKELISSLELTALLKQPEFHDAFIGITAKLGILGTNVPAANAGVRISGIELANLGSVVPPGVAQTLGGSCIDVYIDLAMAYDILDCKAKVKTEDNTMRIAVGGTPTKPSIDKSTALGNLVTRPGAIVGGVIGDAGGAGLKVATGAAETTLAVGTGAAKVVGGLGKGLFKTVKGVATADVSEIKGGLLDTTVGTVTTTKDAVVDSASTAATSIGEAASTAINKDDVDAWRNGCQERWQELWTEAQEKVEQAPYPQSKESSTDDNEIEAEDVEKTELEGEQVETIETKSSEQ